MKQFFFFLLLVSVIRGYSQNRGSTFESELVTLFDVEFSSDEPGGSILVKKGAQIIFLKSYGIANIVTKEKITKNTIFNTGSISKTFVAYGILKLKEQELLSLDDNLAAYFKDFKSNEIARKVRIRNLLTHTSGLPDIRNVQDNFNFFLTAKDEGNFNPLKQVKNLNFQPGESFEYSNPSFNGLALIIEKVTNGKWQEFIKKEIFIPSGMTNSKITDGSFPQNGVAHGYVLNDSVYVESDYGEVPTFSAAGNGGIWSSVIELSKYEQAIQSNIFLNVELTSLSRTIFQPTNWVDSEEPKIGYSWFIKEKPLAKIVYHTGSQGGFNSIYITIPEKDILYIGLFNRPLKDFWKHIWDVVPLMEKYNWLD